MMVMVVAHAPSLMDLIFKTQREQAKTAQLVFSHRTN